MKLNELPRTVFVGFSEPPSFGHPDPDREMSKIFGVGLGAAVSAKTGTRSANRATEFVLNSMMDVSRLRLVDSVSF